MVPAGTSSVKSASAATSPKDRVTCERVTVGATTAQRYRLPARGPFRAARVAASRLALGTLAA